jgi:predicted DNA-binding transcriptional regulator YafY
MSRERNRQLTRTWTLVRRLDGLHVGLTPTELAAEFGVCRRTITGDLEALEAAGFPLVEAEGRWNVFNWRNKAA